MMIWAFVKAAARLLFLRLFSFSMREETRQAKIQQVYNMINHLLPQKEEKYLRDSIEYIDAAFVMYDINGELIMCNRHFLEMYHYTKEEACSGTHFRDLGAIDVARGNVVIGDELGSDYLARKAEYRKNPRGTFTVELADGRWIMTRDRRTDDGSLVSIQTDITDIKETETALMVAKEEAELANRAKSEFLANMSHELRTPLNSIIGFSSILESQIEFDNDRNILRGYAADINESGAYLLRVINEILDMAKVEAGQLELMEDE